MQCILIVQCAYKEGNNIKLADIKTPKESQVTCRTGGQAFFNVQITGLHEGISFEWKFGSTVIGGSTQAEVGISLYLAIL